MWDIEKRFKDDDKSYRLRLNSNQVITPHTVVYPIKWQGFLNNNEIEFNQLNQSASSTGDYDFLIFPDKYENIKPSIANIIHRFLNKLN